MANKLDYTKDDHDRPRHLQVVEWNKLYESHVSRKTRDLGAVYIPNRFDDKISDLIRIGGAALYGGYMAMVLVASRRVPRGHLLKDDDSPHDHTSLSGITYLDEDVLEQAIDLALACNLMMWSDAKPARQKRDVRASTGRALQPLYAGPAARLRILGALGYVIAHSPSIDAADRKSVKRWVDDWVRPDEPGAEERLQRVERLAEEARTKRDPMTYLEVSLGKIFSVTGVPYVPES